MAILLGGRGAELLVFNEFSTGAADDLVKVTNIAEALVTKYGMSPTIGMVVYEQQLSPFLESPLQGHEIRHYSEDTAHLIDLEIKNVIDVAKKITEKILQQNRAVLEEGAQQLLEKETLSEADLKTLFKKLVPTEISINALWKPALPARPPAEI